MNQDEYRIPAKNKQYSNVTLSIFYWEGIKQVLSTKSWRYCATKTRTVELPYIDQRPYIDNKVVLNLL